MATWDDWVKTLQDQHNCVFGGIYDTQGNPWAQTTGSDLTPTTAQIADIVKGIQGQKDLRAEGPKLGNRKFMTLEVTDTLATMKQMGGDSNTKVMAAVSLAKSCCVLAIAPAGEHERKAKGGADAVGESLRQSGM